jgi:hypothetical protein
MTVTFDQPPFLGLCSFFTSLPTGFIPRSVFYFWTIFALKLSYRLWLVILVRWRIIGCKEFGMSKRLSMLQKSLEKKEHLFDTKLANHFETVAQSNGQPLNDKRNGSAVMDKWAKQNDSIRALNEGIETTKQAIEREQSKIAYVDAVSEDIPVELLDLVKTGELVQWRKHPNTFFVPGVDKARIVWHPDTKLVAHKYTNQITEKDQRVKFVRMYNGLNQKLNK